jgi:hypothetical protein
MANVLCCSICQCCRCCQCLTTRSGRSIGQGTQSTCSMHRLDITNESSRECENASRGLALLRVMRGGNLINESSEPARNLVHPRKLRSRACLCGNVACITQLCMARSLASSLYSLSRETYHFACAMQSAVVVSNAKARSYYLSCSLTIMHTVIAGQKENYIYTKCFCFNSLCSSSGVETRRD